MTLHKHSSTLGPDQVGDPPSSPPQVEVQAIMEAHTEPLRASPMPDIPKPASCPDKAGDPPSSLPQVEVQATMGTHTEPLEAPATIDMHELVNASSTIVKHKQSLASAHEAVDRPSPPNQVEGPDTTFDATRAHTEPPRASPTIVEPDATTEPTNPTLHRPESTLGSDTTTLVQQTEESTIHPGNHNTKHDETSDSDNEILAYSPGEMHSPGEFDHNSIVMTSMPTSSSSPHPLDA
ncbi:uncharacterized protein [Miscanthus floridulus]|uniref:uncharacterized protein n=1 Tax=Miscanthus floridulus TaxID=154761 RepID=UPI003458E1BC